MSVSTRTAIRTLMRGGRVLQLVSLDGKNQGWLRGETHLAWGCLGRTVSLEGLDGNQLLFLVEHLEVPTDNTEKHETSEVFQNSSIHLATVSQGDYSQSPRSSLVNHVFIADKGT
jgi:hypothetical protein